MSPESSNEETSTRTSPTRSLTPGEREAEHQAVHRRLCEYARHRSALDAAEAFDLVRAEQFKLYALHACATHYEYMERILGYGPHAARERMRVARALVRLPETTAALARGELSYSAVRELTRVATDETETAWLARARGLVVHQIERLVANHQLGDHPDDPPNPSLRPRVVRVELPPEVYALWRQARMVVAEERGAEISDADFVETICRAMIAPGSGAVGPAHQIAYQQCPDCRRAAQNGAGRDIDIAPEVFERASCDARHLGSLDAPVPERMTTTVTPRIREQVFARDHHRCTAPGCRSARNLEVHHIVEQAHGGTHELSNLCLLCSGHHAALHAGLLTIRGRAPHELELRWAYGPPIPVGLTPAAREALIDERVSHLLARVVPEGEVERGALSTPSADLLRARDWVDATDPVRATASVRATDPGCTTDSVRATDPVRTTDSLGAADPVRATDLIRVLDSVRVRADLDHGDDRCVPRGIWEPIANGASCH